MNNYQAAAAQAGFPPASPHAAGGHGGPQGRSFPAANSPGPIDMYSSGAAAAAAVAAADSVASYVQAAASPQPPTTAFPAIAVSRAPLNYSPVSPLNAPPLSGPSRGKWNERMKSVIGLRDLRCAGSTCRFLHFCITFDHSARFLVPRVRNKTFSVLRNRVDEWNFRR